MARGGIYDQLGGGFHRYSTDERWLVPALRENALRQRPARPSPTSKPSRSPATPFYREIVEETLGYVLREMTSPEGAFYSTQDADSEGVEGKFFVWTRPEIDADPRPRGGETFCSVYDVTADGNWEGHNILHLSRSLDVEAKMLSMPLDELKARLHRSKQKLWRRAE